MNTTTETTTPDPSPDPSPKRLERAKDGRMFTGVAAGLGRYLGIDANLVRIGFVFLTFLGGSGVAAYLIAALLLPGEGGEPPIIKSMRRPWRSGAGRTVIGAALLVLAAAAVLGSIESVHWDAAAGIAIVGLGVVLIASSFAGGARWLIVPGLLLAGAVGFLKAADVHLQGGWGDRDIAVASAADLHDRYDLSAGQLRLDLRDVQLAAGEERSVRARVGMGDLVIRVPQDVAVEADARSGAGQVELFGRDSDGLDVTRSSSSDEGTGAGTGGTLHLDADVGLGRVVVVRDPAPMAAVAQLGWDRTL
jgi:phage shock protein PspC (stress-responsive transcriptional regulator)